MPGYQGRGRDRDDHKSGYDARDSGRRRSQSPRQDNQDNRNQQYSNSSTSKSPN